MNIDLWGFCLLEELWTLNFESSAYGQNNATLSFESTTYWQSYETLNSETSAYWQSNEHW